MNRAEVGVGTGLGKRIRKLLVGVSHLGLEHTVCADNRMGNIIPVCPSNRRSGSHRERPGRETKIIDLYFRDLGWRLLRIRRDSWRSH